MRKQRSNCLSRGFKLAVALRCHCSRDTQRVLRRGSCVHPSPRMCYRGGVGTCVCSDCCSTSRREITPRRANKTALPSQCS